MSKRIISFILVGLMIFSLTGCGSKAEKIMNVLLEDETTVSTESDQETNTIEDNVNNNVVEDSKNNTNIENDVEEKDGEAVEDIKEGTTFLTKIYDESGKSAEDIAVAFLRYIRNEEYDKLVPLMVDDGAKFVSGADIYDVLIKNDSKFLKITDKDCLVEVKQGSVNEGVSRVSIKLKTTDENYDNTLYECTIPIKLNEDNLWRVDLIDDLAVKDLGIILPKNCTLFIDEVEVNRDVDVSIRPYEDDIELEIWNFDYIGRLEKTLKVKSPVFEVTTSLLPEERSYDKTIKPVLEVSEDLSVKARDYTKNLFVELINASANGVISLEQVEKYVSNNAAKGTANNIMENYKKESRNLSNRYYRNIEVSQIIDHPTEIDYWYTDDCMEVFFGMTVSWENESSKSKWVTETMDRYFSVKLEYANGEFKIADMDTRLFKGITLFNSTVDDF